MISRIIHCVINPARVDEFRTELNGQILPRIQEQKGFVDNIESLDTATGQFCCLTQSPIASYSRITARDFFRKSQPSYAR